MSDRIIIGTMGFAGSGKDAVGAVLVGMGWERLAFADALKVEAFAEGWSGRKDDEGRRFLQELGIRRREADPLYWIRKLLDALDDAGPRVVITDVRFRNEAANLTDRGALLWRVIRPGVGPANGHVSEIEHLKITPDATIPNDGTLDALRIVVEHHLRLAGIDH